MVNTTAVMATKAMPGRSTQNWIAYVGDKASRIVGRCTICGMPSTARQMNQTIMTGPNARPTLPVPDRWTANRMARTSAEPGSTSTRRSRLTTCRPSMADITEMAGVISESPKNKAAPTIPIARMVLRNLVPVSLPRSSAVNARMPPSPSLSARITRTMYLSVTMMINDQTTSEMMPYTFSSVTRTSLWLTLNAVCRE